MRWFFASVTLFRISGVPVRAHFTWLLYVAGLTAWICWGRWTWRAMLAVGIILIVALGSLLVHEFAHVLVARRYGCKTSCILLLPIGCVADLEEMPCGPHEIHMALAGPLASTALGIASYLALLPLAHQFGYGFRIARAIVLMLCLFNFIVAGFNLIPCFPMDGGRVLRSLLSLLIGRASPGRASDAFLLATRIAVRYVARPLAVGLIVVSCLFTRLWMHAVLFSLMILAGEAEFRQLQRDRDLDQGGVEHEPQLPIEPGGVGT